MRIKIWLFIIASAEQKLWFLQNRQETSSQHMTSGKAGFSIVELMVVVSIVAVMGSLSLSGLEAFNRSKNKAPIEQILADLRLARAMAASEKRDVKVTFTDDAEQYSRWVDRNDNGSVNTGEIELVILGGEVTSLYSFPHTGTFKPDGTLDAGGNTYLYVGICTQSDQDSLYVSQSGQANIL